uniref:Uncharacterized protein n=1 Tax=Meloidogyne enterolobii TaxID=390850 RepID=A0A6V7X648_MELEN|nr:unnamed protein product [Meloidogyne enterolobii]
MEIEDNKPHDASENLSLNNSETIKDNVDKIDIVKSQTENKKSKKKKSKQKKNDLKIEEPVENIDKETTNLKMELVEKNLIENPKVSVNISLYYSNYFRLKMINKN